MDSKLLSFTLLALFVLFLPSHSFYDGSMADVSCIDCDNDDCSDDNVGKCSDHYSSTYGGCVWISSVSNELSCPDDTDTSWNKCGSQDYPIGSIVGFTYSGENYYCTNYDQTGTKLWKTCYSSAPDGSWVSEVLSCDSGKLYECGSLGLGAAAGQCTVNGTFYCDLSSGWETSSEARDDCEAACNEEYPDEPERWTGSKCCDSGDYYVEGYWACNNGNLNKCDSMCEETSVGNGYYCDTGLGWRAPSDSCGSCGDEFETICTNHCDDLTSGDDGIAYFDLTTSYCCGDDSGEYLLHRVCSDGCQSSEGDTACCGGGTHCVMDGDCYGTGCQVSKGQSYCDSGSWTSNTDSEQLVCSCLRGEGKWTGTQCCDSGDDYVEGDKACVNGVVSTCTSCGQTAGSYYCDGSSWTTSPEPDSCSGNCEAMGHEWDDSTNECCDDGTDSFLFNTESSRVCEDGGDYVCDEYHKCDSRAGYNCINDGGAWVWSEATCSSNGACINGVWKSSCDVLDGWYGGGDAAGCPGDDPAAEERGYSCSGGQCDYSILQTSDCDSSGEDGWYGGGNSEGCGTDPGVEQRDYYFDTSSGSCTHSVCSTGGSCDENDDCSPVCEGTYASGGGIDYYWPALNGEDTLPSCTSSMESGVDCATKASEEFLDSGADVSKFGYVLDYVDCLEGSCTYNNHSDHCQDAGTVVEYSLDGASYTESVTSCGEDTCLEDPLRSLNVKYWKDYACQGAKCTSSEINLDTSELLCTDPSCGLEWVSGYGSPCCGDDPGERHITSSLDGTSWCCSSSDYCVLGGACKSDNTEVTFSGGIYGCQSGVWGWVCNTSTYPCSGKDDCCSGSCATSYGGDSACCDTGHCWTGTGCVPTGSLREGGFYLCSSGQWAGAGNDCGEVFADKQYYALNGEWVSAGVANASCGNACQYKGGEWLDWQVREGFRCCLPSSEGSVLHTEGDEALCSDSWLKASLTSGIKLSYYLSTGSAWKRCESIGEEVTVGTDTYLCTEDGWQDKVCGLQGDDYQSTCESCGGTWLGLGGEQDCCGNAANDEFLVNGTALCDGTAGLELCDLPCESVSLGGNDYYCFEGSWMQDADFSGGTLVEGGSSSGCCEQGQCWDGGCFDTGYRSEGDLCSSGTWLTCSEQNLCQFQQTTEGTFHCSDDGWTLAEAQFCHGLSGLCVNQSCRLCGTDYSVGDTVNGHMCTSSGIFSSGCISDEDCLSSGECKVGRCEGGSCVYENVKCGAQCSTGTCDGSGSCVSLSFRDEPCACTGMCAEGLYCDGSKCIVAEDCGDGECQEGECSACAQDCSLSECTGDDVCSPLVGEDCGNSEDCGCGAKYCDTTSSYADSWGCVASACDNGKCESGECSFCTADCGVEECAGNGRCDTILGETCSNSPDCNCQIIVSADTIPVLRVGETARLKVLVENKGNAPMVFRLDLQTEGLRVVGGNRTLYMAPNEVREVFLEVEPTGLGQKSIRVLANPSEGDSIEAGEVEVHVKSQTPWERIMMWFKASPFYEFYDFIQLVAFVGGGLFTFFKIILPWGRKPNYYQGQVPGYYYGSQYQQTYPGYPQR